MKLIELTEKDRALYNQFVAASQGGSFLQSWEWGEWQKALGREVIRLNIIEEDAVTGTSSVVGAAQLIKMPLVMGKYYWYCPYGPVVSEQLSVDSYQLLQGLRNKFSDAVFIRVESKDLSLIPYPLSLVSKSPNIQPSKTLIIDLAKSEDQLLADMHHKTRYNIRLAEKHGVEVQDEFILTVGKGLYAKEAVDLVYETSKRQGYNAQPREYFEKLINFFALRNKQADLKLHIYKALYEKQILASAIVIDFGKIRTYLFGGSSEENKNLMAPYLLHWRAMLDAKANGLSGYDFWGIETSSGATPGFVRFKLGFASSESAIKQYAGAYDIITRPAWYQAYKFLRILNRLAR